MVQVTPGRPRTCGRVQLLETGPGLRVEVGDDGGDGSVLF